MVQRFWCRCCCLQRLLQLHLRRYDHNQSNQTTARDLVIMTYNFIKKYPYILKYTSKPVVAVKEGTPYEEAFETYNYSIPGADYGLKGVDGSKTGSSPEGAFNSILIPSSMAISE